MIKLSVIACLLSAAVTCGGETPNPTDVEVEFWEKRQSPGNTDPQNSEKLGAAYLQKVRETGDFTLLSKAEAALKQALKLKADYTEAVNWLAQVYALQCRFKEALALCDKAKKLAPNEGFAYGTAGDIALEQGDIEQAESQYVRALELSPDTFTYARIAKLNYMRGGIPDAVNFYKQALDDARANKRNQGVIAWCETQLGYLYFRIGKLEKAEEYYQSALKTDPEGHLALEHLAELRGAEEKYDEAAGLYVKVIALAPLPEYYQALGELLVAAQQADKAKPHLDKAAELYLEALNAGNNHYLHHMASFFNDARPTPADALRWAKRDYDLRKNVYAMDGLAWAHFNSGEFKEASALIKKALATGIRDSHIYNHAAMIYFRAGNVPGSKEMLRKAAELNPLYNKFHEHRN